MEWNGMEWSGVGMGMETGGCKGKPCLVLSCRIVFFFVLFFRDCCLCTTTTVCSPFFLSVNFIIMEAGGG